MSIGMHLRFHWLAYCLAPLCLSTALVAAQEDDDDFVELPAGLIATYQVGDARIERLDNEVQFVWNDRRADPRLPAGALSAQWQGKLFILEPGSYRLHVHVAGAVEIELNEQPVLVGQHDRADWLVSEPIELGYGHHPFVARYRQTGATARIGLYWSGTRFRVEPIPDRHLFHDRGQTPDGQFEQGQTLARALRCEACHTAAPAAAALPAPALTHLRGNVTAEWLIERLAPAADRADNNATLADGARRMPHFQLTKLQAADVAAWLLDQSRASPAPPPVKIPGPKPGAKGPKPRTKPTVEDGARLAHTVGCLACHRVGELGQAGLMAGGDLSQVATKRPADFFHRWLSDPSQVNADHRMPVFKLSELERADLVAWLSTLSPSGEPAVANRPDALLSGASAERGQELVVEHRCQACHRTAETLPVAKLAGPLSRTSNWQRGCIAADAAANTRHPRYQLATEERRALQVYYTNRAKAGPAVPALDGRFVLAERNCLACHARGFSAGIVPTAEQVAAAHPELAALQPALAPPSLNGVGDKLTTEALEAAIAVKRAPLRPWLMVRMPKFNLAADEMAALTEYLVNTDRIPDLPPESLAENDADLDETARELAGRRLVTADGFGCTSCHQIGNSVPERVVLNAQGSDLTMVGERLRRPWFDRWVRNPARIVPRMEMPAIQMPIRGVLHEGIDEQLAAVWHVLNQPGFNPPKPNPVRVVRARNLPGIDEPASILTDVFEIGEQVFIKPWLVGLANRHNVMFDLEENRLAGWWVGDTGLQRTRAKSWYWEIGGDPLTAPLPDSELILLPPGADARPVEPSRWGQFLCEPDGWQHQPNGARLDYRLRFANVPGYDQPLVLSAAQTFAWRGGRDDTANRSGFERQIELSAVPAGARLRWVVLGGAATLAADGRSATLAGWRGEPRVELIAPDGARLDVDGKTVTVTLTANNQGVAAATLAYSADLPIDRFPVDLPEFPAPPSVPITALPGFDGVRLPLPVAEMPIGLAWRADGTLLFGSLKGQVFEARDTSGDGLEDTLTPISDDLASPYGLHVLTLEDGREVVDVITKYALVRLYDETGDRRADRTELIASGWGHTVDYHDWTVGLPRDEQGNYYVAIPCQQDDRTPEAAHLRGHGVRLVPRAPTADNPRRYAIEEFCGGLRFPMGLALNHHGDLFASDNQGHYKPFNELNHLRQGLRYGYLNSLERSPDFNPPRTPPAIDIPHPWTRSVNGICFLYTPEAVRKLRGANLFGPFEGHLVGCEYNQCFLVRMSLQPVGDTYQGAIYPFDLPAASAEEPHFEGPSVCGVAPNGDLLIGSLRDSAWGGGQNTGSFVRFRANGDWLPGIAEVRAGRDGFEIDFTQPVDATLAGDLKRYTLNAYRRISTPRYGGEDLDRQSVRVREVRLSSDRRRAVLYVDKMLPDFVYEFYLQPLVADGRQFYPAEAHYTLRVVPEAAVSLD